MDFDIVELKTKDKLYLQGILFSNKEITQKIIIHLHGFGSSILKSFQETKEVASYYVENQIAYFIINTRGAGLVTKIQTDEKYRVIGSCYEKIEESIFDIETVIEYCIEMGFKDIYISGHSAGANKIAYTFSRNEFEQVKKCFLLSGADDIGLYWQQFGTKKIKRMIKKTKKEIKKGRSDKLFLIDDLDLIHTNYTFHSFAEPNSNYNIFPFYEFENREYGWKLEKLFFQDLNTISQDCVFIYGENDYGCIIPPNRAIQILMSELKKEHKYYLIKEKGHSIDAKEIIVSEIMSE